MPIMITTTKQWECEILFWPLPPMAQDHIKRTWWRWQWQHSFAHRGHKSKYSPQQSMKGRDHKTRGRMKHWTHYIILFVQLFGIGVPKGHRCEGGDNQNNCGIMAIIWWRWLFQQWCQLTLPVLLWVKCHLSFQRKMSLSAGVVKKMAMFGWGAQGVHSFGVCGFFHCGGCSGRLVILTIEEVLDQVNGVVLAASQEGPWMDCDSGSQEGDICILPILQYFLWVTHRKVGCGDIVQ